MAFVFRLKAEAQSAMVSRLVSVPKSASVSPLPDVWVGVLLKLAVRWLAMSEESVRAGSAYAPTSTSAATSKVNDGRHGTTRPPMLPLPIRHAVRMMPTAHATAEMALKIAVNQT